MPCRVKRGGTGGGRGASGREEKRRASRRERRAASEAARAILLSPHPPHSSLLVRPICAAHSALQPLTRLVVHLAPLPAASSFLSTAPFPPRAAIMSNTFLFTCTSPPELCTCAQGILADSETLPMQPSPSARATPVRSPLSTHFAFLFTSSRAPAAARANARTRWAAAAGAGRARAAFEPVRAVRASRAQGPPHGVLLAAAGTPASRPQQRLGPRARTRATACA